MTILRDISFLWSMLHIIVLFLLLFEPRFSWRTTLIASFAGAGTLLVFNVLAMFWLGHGIIMSAAFFTCTVPTLLLFFVLSKYRDGRFFFLFCLMDTVCFWLLQITNFLDRLAGGAYVALLISRLILFPAMEFLFWRYLRRPYRELQRTLTRSWWLFAATGAVYYVLIMCTSVPVDAPMPDATGIARILLVLLLMPLTYLTIFHSLWQQIQVHQGSRQIELQRRDYDAVCQKMELGRVYRHDMRHHLAVMSGMLQLGDSDGTLQYIQDLAGRLDSLSQVTWCANRAINAVLSSYITQAEQHHCTIDAKVRAPAELPYEETDICVILANALENATHACQKLPEEERTIGLDMELTDNLRLTIAVRNPCPQPVKFTADGLPDVAHFEGHGLGLRSVQTVAQKYNGLFRCQWEKGQFLFQTVLFPPSETGPASQKPASKRITVVLLSILLSFALLNCIPPLANALERIPVLGPIIRIFDLRTYTLDWGGDGLTIRQPGLDGTNLTPELSEGIQEANEQSEEFIARMEERFLQYLSQRQGGHVGAEVDYEVLQEDDALLELRFTATVNVGGSVNYSRCLVLSKASGQVLSLADLFQPEAPYVSLLSREVSAQMHEQVNAGEGAYFLSGGMWPEEDCFQQIDPEQDFYLNEDGQLVLVFEEYTVAPGSMGTPEFTIPTELVEGILVQPSLLQ